LLVAASYQISSWHRLSTRKWSHKNGHSLARSEGKSQGKFVSLLFGQKMDFSAQKQGKFPLVWLITNCQGNKQGKNEGQETTVRNLMDWTMVAMAAGWSGDVTESRPTPSEPVMFQVWRWNKITDFIPKLLDFEITVNLTVDFIPNGWFYSNQSRSLIMPLILFWLLDFVPISWIC
jgi:hypothetical protein